ncbi:MAG: hypothetical protein M0Z42_03780 [Actinomycetota bacterium]|nr:hypothetical protein [Actinomycetota bacterium]
MAPEDYERLQATKRRRPTYGQWRRTKANLEAVRAQVGGRRPRRRDGADRPHRVVVDNHPVESLPKTAAGRVARQGHGTTLR